MYPQMKRIFFFLLLTILTLPTLSQTDTLSVRFQVKTLNLSDSGKVYITGNRPQLGNWHPGRVALSKDHSNSTWSLELRFARGEMLEYKFTKGKWSNEAVLEGGLVPPNNKLTVENDTTLYIEIKYWKDAFTAEVQRGITGIVNYHRRVGGTGLDPRDLLVWLPPGYEQNTQQRYPVLYMQDGQNLFDPLTSTFGMDWQVDETADSLIRLQKIDPLIVVGIYNTNLRSREYSPNDTGSAYMKYVVQTVKPLIDNTYRTLPDRDHTATGGSSLGGLISFMLMWEYPDIFSKAACFSPVLKIEPYDYVSRVQQDGRRNFPIKIYLDNGGVGLEAKLQPGIEEMMATLDSIGYMKGTDFFWYLDSTAQHNESAWARRFWRPLVLFWGRN